MATPRKGVEAPFYGSWNALDLTLIATEQPSTPCSQRLPLKTNSKHIINVDNEVKEASAILPMTLRALVSLLPNVTSGAERAIGI